MPLLPLPLLMSRSLEAAQTACTNIGSQLGGDAVKYISDPAYNSTTSNIWSLFNANIETFAPACIVYPHQASDVQNAMKEIFDAQSTYSVIAGSHSAMPGWNTVDEGVLISFSGMTEVNYDESKDSVTLDPGVHWGDVITQLEPSGISVAGGRMTDVGTGLLLGGGISFLAPSVGFSADTLVSADVVLANGTLVTATASNEYSDLFRALKGGGNRFGIVTRYELQALHTGTKDDLDWFGGVIKYNQSETEQVLKAAAHYTQNMKDPNATIMVVITEGLDGSGNASSQASVNAFYKGSSLPEEIFGEFLSIPSTFSSLTPLSYLDVSSYLGPTPGNRGAGHLFGSAAIEGSEDLFLETNRLVQEYTKAVGSSINTTTLAFTPIPQSQIDAGRKNGGNAIDPPDGNYAVVEIERIFKTGELYIPGIVELYDQRLFANIPISKGKPLFLNKCDSSQRVFETYGAYEFLKQTYKKYDPTGFIVKYMDGPWGLEPEES